MHLIITTILFLCSGLKSIGYINTEALAASGQDYPLIIRAWLDWLLIAIRSSFIACDHVRSKTRLITIIRLIAKLEIINTTRPHNGILSIVSLPPRRSINTAKGEREGGEWVSQLQQQHAL